MVFCASYSRTGAAQTPPCLFIFIYGNTVFSAIGPPGSGACDFGTWTRLGSAQITPQIWAIRKKCDNMGRFFWAKTGLNANIDKVENVLFDARLLF